MGDWPIKEYLKRHFANQRSYKRHVLRAKAAAAAQGKGKGKAVQEDSMDSMDSWDALNSGMDTSNEKSKEEAEEEC